MTSNVYIHIPFCKQKCYYCTFVSTPKLEQIDEYLTALKLEIKTKYKGELLKTLYIGGGTPTLIGEKELKNLIDMFNTDENTEITIESNPENIISEYHMNRLSIGCQTFNDDILKLIGRKHSAHDIELAIQRAKDNGIKNISLDLIYGLPNQTIEMFADDLKKAISLDIQHISLYGLKIDGECYFEEHPPENLPDLDMQADMYLRGLEVLLESGFEQYEVSSFSRAGFNSRHNLNYWNNSKYYGFGAAAHGYENKTRYNNSTKLQEYIKNPLVHADEYTLSDDQILEEEIFLAFRKIEGLDVDSINKKFGIDFEKMYSKILNKYSDYLEKTEKGYKLTRQGILVSNEILSGFI